MKILERLKKPISILAISSLVFQMLFMGATPVLAAAPTTTPTITVSGAPATVLSGDTTPTDFTYTVNNTSNTNYSGIKYWMQISNVQASEFKTFNYINGSTVTPITIPTETCTYSPTTTCRVEIIPLPLDVTSGTLSKNAIQNFHFQIAFNNLSNTVPETHTIFFSAMQGAMSIAGFNDSSAVFTVNNPVTKYNANFVVDGVTTTVPTAAGAVIAVPANPTKPGYTFTGWSPAVPATMPASAQTFVAQWSLNNYTITFNSAGGTSVPNITQGYATTITAPSNPTRTGYTFTGWTPSLPATMPIGGANLTAGWSLNQYSAFFNVDGVITTVPTNYGAAITKPADPTKTGYTFAGWLPAVPATMPASNQTFVAQWTINQYAATFNSDGGSAVPPQTVDYNSLLTEPATPTKGTDNFVGWFYGNGFHTQWDFSTDRVVGSITLKAKWTKNFILTYDANGGVGVPSTAAYKEGSCVVVSSIIPVREGYIFTGWNTQVDGNGTGYQAGDDITIDSNITLYAQWTVNSYDATFNVDGALTVVPTNYGATIEVPADPAKTGYTFAGWLPVVPESMPANDVTFIAQWTVNSYDATFNVDGALTVVPTNYGATIEVPADPAKTGYTFAGWLPVVPESMPANDVTFIAQWTVNSYDATFNVDGALTVVPTNYGATIEVPADPAKTGYTFAGWLPVVPESMPANDVTFIAQWTVNQYTVSFISNGGTVVAPATYDYNTLVTAPVSPTRTGYVFAGWYKDSTLLTKWAFETDKIVADTGLYAKWVLIPEPTPNTGGTTGGASTAGTTTGEVAGVSTTPTPTPSVTPTPTPEVKGAKDSNTDKSDANGNWWGTHVLGLDRWIWGMLLLIAAALAGYWWFVLGKKRNKKEKK